MTSNISRRFEVRISARACSPQLNSFSYGIARGGVCVGAARVCVAVSNALARRSCVRGLFATLQWPIGLIVRHLIRLESLSRFSSIN